MARPTVLMLPPVEDVSLCCREADAVVALRHDPGLGRRIGENGFTLVRNRFGPEHVRSAVPPL